MNEPRPPLQRVNHQGNDKTLRNLGVVIVVATIAFVIGLGMGAGPVAPATTPAPSPAPTEPIGAPIVGFEVSHDLETAYLNRGTEGWGVCVIAAEITCRPIVAAGRAALSKAFPERVTEGDWVALSPIMIAGGRYVLAAPMIEVGPWAVIAGVNDAGFPTYRAIPTQAVSGGVFWADLGTLGRGRYVVSVGAYSLSTADAQGRSNAQLVGWGVGVMVNGNN